MARFRYKAYNQSGVRQDGVLEAESEQQARQRLLDDGLLLEELTDAVEGQTLSLFNSSQLNLSDIEFITSELALLLTAGLKVDKGLAILIKNVSKPALREFLQKVLNQLKQGETLSSALAEHPAFSELYIGLVKIGEETGDLTGVFSRLSSEIKYQLDLRDKIRQALVYPAVILTVCLGALIFIFNFVVPNLADLFAGQDDLPAYTRALMGVSHFMLQWQWYLFFGIVAGAIAIYQLRNHPSIVESFSWMRESLPIVKRANLLVERIRFNAGLATMLASGIAIDRALKLALNTLRTASLRNEVRLATENVKRGQGLALSLSETRLYPDYYAALLAIGEESGELAQVFGEMAERSRRTFYAWVTKFTSLLEPLLILVMGGIVGSVVVIMMLSISAGTDIAL
ncbi:MAG: type II secretion system F family protein [Aliidiomarina sp.]|uniref:type II secretion system F family protein n=1 Tax=Aliidiomarina sp. TaxID=1872439 RepID=UPI0025C27083|nr:type II secretion system F family protein [Aliidiomarina sp.]MCH8502469.1 type II secretion system F family protein [Aliidiomarina sp.]